MQENSSFEIRFVDLWTVLKRCWWILVLVVAIVTTGLYVYKTQTHTPTYQSTAMLHVGRENSSNYISSSDVNVATMLVKDFNEFIKHETIALKVKEATGTMATAAQLQSMLSISNPEESRILYITVTAESPESAQMLVNSYADIACTEFNALFDIKDAEGVLKAEQKMVKIAAAGLLNPNISNPVSFFKIFLTAFLLAVLIYVVFLVVFLLDDKINNAEDVQRYLGISLLGEIPNRADVKRRRARYGYYQMDAPQSDRK